MGKACEAFQLKDANKAAEHMSFNFEIIADYGDDAYGHPLYVWDDGKRMLARCKKCGGYILIQKSEYHGMEDDGYYTDYFPVESEEAADEINRRYNGFDLELKSGIRYLINDIGGVPHWSREE